MYVACIYVYALDANLIIMHTYYHFAPLASLPSAAASLSNHTCWSGKQWCDAAVYVWSAPRLLARPIYHQPSSSPGQEVASKARLVQQGVAWAHSEEELASVIGCQSDVHLDGSTLHVGGCNQASMQTRQRHDRCITPFTPYACTQFAPPGLTCSSA